MNQAKTPTKEVGGYVIDVRGKGRQFQNELLEKLSFCPGWMPLVVYLPVIAVCWYFTATDTTTGFGAAAGLAVAGIAFWTFSEYVLHRFVFHFRKWPKLHYFIHGIHHEYPNDLGRVVMPPTASAFLAVPLWFLALGALGYEAALPFFSGFVIGYLWYDMTHWWTHVGKPKGPWGKMLRRHHMLHHFSSPAVRFGVTSPFWDHVFGTSGEEKTEVEGPSPSPTLS